LGRTKEAILNLKRAVMLSDEVKEMAREEKAFENIRSLEEFSEITKE
jgi:hypothetical protein